jgi:two-component system nitrogen regulation response regulator GlnG
LAADVGVAAVEARPLPVAAPAMAAAVEPASPVAASVPQTAGLSVSAAGSWLTGLEQDARQLLQAGEAEVWDKLTHKFEAQLIRTALEITRGRRIEAAQKLGIGRNTITRKIQELGLDD